jgi:hypothetical protein
LKMIPTLYLWRKLLSLQRSIRKQLISLRTMLSSSITLLSSNWRTNFQTNLLR